MTRRTNPTGLNLQEAIAILLHNQASFVTQMAESNKRMEEYRRVHLELEADIKRTVASIERRFVEIDRVLRELPEAIRQKIGFKAK